MLPLNLLIDGLVLFFTMKVLGMDERKEILKKALWKTWLFGFLADFIGTAAMFSVNLLEPRTDGAFWQWWYENLTNNVSYNPFASIYSILWVLLCVVITAGFIYLFNQKICLKKAVPDLMLRRKLSLSLAIFTAPYLFFLPTAWFVNY